MAITEDQNFDTLSSRFRKNIYDTPKGQIRLKILWRDFIESLPHIEKGGLSILDAGAGQGHFALKLAQKSHQLTLCDVSKNMLDDAKKNFAKYNLDKETKFIHGSVQELIEQSEQQYDVVLFHAVLEWLVEPEQTLKKLLSLIRPGGYLSLMFYSRTGLIYQNLSRGNFDYVLNDTLAGEGKSLTPTNPQDPLKVQQWLEDARLTILNKSGVRVFYDALSRERRKDINEAQLYDLEKEYSRKEPYCSLARYVHILCKKLD